MKLLILPLLLICSLSYGQTWTATYAQRDTTNAVDTPQRPYVGLSDIFLDSNDVRWPNPAIAGQHGNTEFFRITAYNLSVNGYSDFDLFMNLAIDRGQKVVFGVATIDEGYLSLTIGGAQLAYPLSVHNAMQAEANPDFIFAGNWWPNYNSASYQAWYATMESQLRAHCNATSHAGKLYKDVIAMRNIDGIGWYGEQHTGGIPISWPTGTQWTLGSLQNIINAQKAVWNDYWWLTFINAGSSNSGLPAGFADYTRTITTLMGPVGLRWDHVGNTGIYNFEYLTNSDANWKNFVSNQWKVAPVWGEPVSFGISAAGQCDWFHAWTEASVYHASVIENGNLPAPMTNCTRDIALQVARMMGYRWTVKSISMSDSIRPGLPFPVTPLFANTGIAPDYFPTTVTYYLYQGATLVKQWNSLLNPFMTLPGNYNINDNSNMTGTFSGVYSLYIKFSFNDGFYPFMPLQMAVNRTSDGKYLLRSNIGVATQTPPPPPPPPPPPNNPPTILMGNNQTDTLPKNVDSLTAQINDLDADTVSYTWSQVSGPNSSTIVTPTGNVNTAFQFILTRITGLIAGTYQYKLVANDGKGGIANSFVNIIVSNGVVVPPPPPPPVYVPPTVNIGLGTPSTMDTTIQYTADSAYLVGNITDTGSTAGHDTTIASVKWTLYSYSGTTVGTIVSSTSNKTKVTGLTPGTYQYNFTVTDKAGNVVTADGFRTVKVLPVIIIVPPPLPGPPLKTREFKPNKRAF